MSGPKRETVAGRTYLELRKKAKAEGRTTEELLQLSALEAFVDRLASSTHAGNMVLKGGVLLAAYDMRRPTKDVDLAGHNIANDLDSVSAVVNEVLRVVRDDGWTFGATRAETIREDAEYSGVRVTVPAHLATASLTFKVDVNIGDVVWPSPVPVALPRLLGGTIATRGYPLSMVVAEKVVTALQRGTVNTRWRDFADIVLLSEKFSFDGAELTGSMVRVASHRAVTLQPLTRELEGYARIGQAKWAAWVRKQRLEHRLPTTFDVALARMFRFADPVLEQAVGDMTWEPIGGAWIASS